MNVHHFLSPALLAATLHATPAPAAPVPAVFGKPVSVALLDTARGGSAVPQAEATLQGTVSGNSAAQVNTGNNIIQDGSFAGATGIPIVIQNSGANVLIQNATVIQLQLR